MADAFDPRTLEVPDRIEGARVCLRPYVTTDAEAIAAAIIESRDWLLPWMPWMPWALDTPTAESYRALIQTWRANFELRKDFGLGIFHREGGRYMGGCGLHRIDWFIRAFEIGYWIRRSESGHGYVTETVHLLTALAFEQLGARRVAIHCNVENERSAAVARRAGYIYEGSLRNGIADAYGNSKDRLVFALTLEITKTRKKVPPGLDLERALTL